MTAAIESTATGQEAEDRRERWSSRLAFYFASVGYAVGFGNIWRFPSLVLEYGGGAFFIPYALALVLIGIPLLSLEIGLGQYYEAGDIQLFGSIHKRLSGIGVTSIACGYMLVTYYSMLLAWVLHAFFDSFGTNFWTQPSITGQEAVAYFNNNIIGSGTVGDDQLPTRIVWENVGYSAVTWFIVFLCVAFSLKVTGRITYFTMGLPIIMLFIFLGRSVTLEGSSDGIYEYMGVANWEVLIQQPEVWSRAVTQIFFSIGVTFGVMTAYGSHCKNSEPAFLNSCVIALSNCMFSFVAGFAVFATLGYLAHIEGVEVDELQYGGFGLVFGSWPVVLGTLPGGEHWIRLFFVMLFFLGIDSAFAFMESCLTVIQDTTIFHGAGRKKVIFGLTLTAWLLSFLYATDAGLKFLDVIDYYINFIMLLVGGFESFAAGWVYGIEDQVEQLGASIVFVYMSTTFGSLVLACCLWFAISNATTALWAGFVGLVAFYLVGMMVVTALIEKRMQAHPDLTWKDAFYTLTVKNVMTLKNDLSARIGWMPTIWALLIKHFIPQVIIVLFANLCNDNNFASYGGYPFTPYQLLGVLCFIFVTLLLVAGIVFPRLYAPLDKPTATVASSDSDTKEDIMKDCEQTDVESSERDEIDEQRIQL